MLLNRLLILSICLSGLHISAYRIALAKPSSRHEEVSAGYHSHRLWRRGKPLVNKLEEASKQFGTSGPTQDTSIHAVEDLTEQQDGHKAPVVVEAVQSRSSGPVGQSTLKPSLKPARVQILSPHRPAVPLPMASDRDESLQSEPAKRVSWKGDIKQVFQLSEQESSSGEEGPERYIKSHVKGKWRWHHIDDLRYKSQKGYENNSGDDENLEDNLQNVHNVQKFKRVLYKKKYIKVPADFLTPSRKTSSQETAKSGVELNGSTSDSTSRMIRRQKARPSKSNKTKFSSREKMRRKRIAQLNSSGA
ncbi:hypothetical protein Pst134EA_004709 [Puccinia striiformis f. sp. tritici]|uniref:hypothetical protein n=1 Tax=Puccinia striiformis f. sp. tritici TaxID=168172 RepID=UPI002007674A|nr:hypothetical protein Pst134EA_004709 [Puccinia striiformis f. sp. tritici]KAH9470788.1 hypothetical protein Pst134EA_004709 [Puccinia striiformis f. sp. tritici]